MSFRQRKALLRFAIVVWLDVKVAFGFLSNEVRANTRIEIAIETTAPSCLLAFAKPPRAIAPGTNPIETTASKASIAASQESRSPVFMRKSLHRRSINLSRTEKLDTWSRREASLRGKDPSFGKGKFLFSRNEMRKGPSYL